MSTKADDTLKSINDLKSTQSKLINSVDGHNDRLKLFDAKPDVVKNKTESYDISFSNLNVQIDSFSNYINSFYRGF